jgi:hypothetical protein
MNRCLRDARVWLPAVIGLALFLSRALPPAADSPLSPATAVALPEPRGARLVGAHDYELLLARSSVHFLVEGTRGRLLVDCPAFRGHLELDAKAGNGRLDLRLDLSSLREPSAEGLGVHHILGAYRATELAYSGVLVAIATSDLPGVQELTFLGRLHFGDRVVQQPMQLWLCSLPGQPLRLQAHGTVPAAAYDLPKRRWFGLVERNDVTLGLDLAWRRRHD